MEDYRIKLGRLIQMSRQNKHWTQADLAKKLSTSQSAINRIESGKQNLSIDMIQKLSEALKIELLSLNQNGVLHFRIKGGRKLSGEISVNTSKNAAVALLCASLINRGKTILRNVANIEEVYRIIEVLESVGVRFNWQNQHRDLEITPPATLDFSKLNLESARRTRSIIMLMGALVNRYPQFDLPYAGGCNLGERTVEPHLLGLQPFGVEVETKNGFYHIKKNQTNSKKVRVVLIERGDTVTENVLMAAALFDGVTEIRNASSNYMVQDLCFYLERLGVQIEGIGTTSLKVRGRSDINQTVEYEISEDPIEAMSLIAAAIVTKSDLTIRRVPVEFIEIELEILKNMGQKMTLSPIYLSHNGRTKLVDLRLMASNLKAPVDKIHPMPFPGVNIDCLPFFAVIAAVAEGTTLIHDWVYENRAIYLAELSKLNVKTSLLDPHRIAITGPTNFRPAEIVTPPALRPAVVIMLAMMAADGESTLRNVYSISRGYEDFARRLSSIGADVETIF